MNVHIDGIIFSLQQYGGISVYFRELLSRFNAEHDVTLTLEGPLQQSLEAKNFPGIRFIDRTSRLFERIRTSRKPGRNHFDVFHSSYYRRPEHHSQPSVVTVHDFFPHRFPDSPKNRLKSLMINSAIKQADHIICISETTKEELFTFVPVRQDQRVSVIYNGVSDIYRPLDSNSKPSLHYKRPFILFVGQRGGYKNFKLAIQALEHLSGMDLFCVGGGAFGFDELVNVSQNTQSRIHHLGFVEMEQLNILYNNAHCLLYPSEYEGFGIPVIEAMRAGCPVVSLNCKAVVEVGGAALNISYDSSDALSLAQVIKDLYDDNLRLRIRKLGFEQSHQFGWDRCFKETMEIYLGL